MPGITNPMCHTFPRIGTFTVCSAFPGMSLGDQYSVADPRPGPFLCFLTPGSGSWIGKNPDPGSCWKKIRIRDFR
jgi:hypothetical protein